MCGPHHCLGRDAFASGPEILRRLLQLRQNTSILEQGCAAFSPGSANRCDQFTRHPGRTSPPLRPRLSCRYTQEGKNRPREVRMKKILLATIIAVAAVLGGPSQAQQTITKDRLIGSWRVLNLKATTGDKVTYPLGEQVAGYVTISPTRFW